MMNRKAFYDAIRPSVNLTTQNVEGFEKFLDYLEQHPLQINSAAYAAATAWWESAQTMHPVKEAYWKSEEWRKQNLRYYPWYGRGLIQTTWEDNYKKIAKAMGLPENTFIKDPDLLLTFQYALPALFVGMEKGIYTGKDLGDYIDDVDESDAEDLREYTTARRIVNGTDKAQSIGNLALVFERGLKAAGYDDKKAVIPTPPASPAPPKDHVPPAPEPQPQTSSGFNMWVFGAIALAAAAGITKYLGVW
jgi:hypothetical protein